MSFTQTRDRPRFLVPVTPIVAYVRGLGQLGQGRLSGMGTVHQFEGRGGTPRPATLTVLSQAFEVEGLGSIPENGG